MFESIVASFLNKYLGKYIQDFDTENLNVGVFSGNVELTDLQLKPEALFELDLPIEVKAGYVAKITVEIPWTSLYTQPVIINVDDILILAGPVTDQRYDADKERQHLRVIKKKRLDDLEPSSSISKGEDDKGFLGKLLTTIVNNVQIFIKNIHIRYEDSLMNADCPFSFGFVISNLSAETTNCKWKVAPMDANGSSIYKLIKVDGFALYWNPFIPRKNLARSQMINHNWRNLMKKSLITQTINGEKFDFIIRPISTKAKIIMKKSTDQKEPKLLADLLLQDVALTISRQQFLNLMSVIESFKLMVINRQFRKYHPGIHPIDHAEEWWHYAYSAILEEYIRPYSWQRIKEHRERYRTYKKLYKKFLQTKHDAEMQIDLQKLEDQLNITNIVLCREEVKLELNKETSKITKTKNESQGWIWNWFSSSVEDSDDEFEIEQDSNKELWSKLTSEEKEQLYQAIGFAEGDIPIEKPKQYIEHKINLTLANCTISLVNYDKDILVLSITQLLTSLETRPSSRAFRLSFRTESFVIEGASIEHDLVPILTADNTISGIAVPQVFALDFEKNPLHVSADYGLALQTESMEIVYHEHSISEVIAFFQLPNVSYEEIKAITNEKLTKVKEFSRSALHHAIQQHKTVHVTVDMKNPYFVIPELGSLQRGGSVLIVDFGRLKIISDLQSENCILENATMTEIEERLYDQFTLRLTSVQVLFGDSGDNWRVCRVQPESECHLIPSITLQLSFFNSVKPDYRQLPQHKLNATISSLKLNLSDRRLRNLVNFVRNLPLPATQGYTDLNEDAVDDDQVKSPTPNFRDMKRDLTIKELRYIKKSVKRNSALPSKSDDVNDEPDSGKRASEDSYNALSDNSDEELRDLARTTKEHGFDDTVTALNTITVLLRFVIGEVVIQLAKSSTHSDRPYLMLRIDKICSEVALMVYGMVVQASLGGIQLVDKIHTGFSGEYLELVSSKSNTHLISFLYQKVNPACPDFKLSFDGVEQTIIIKLTMVNTIFHRGAFLDLKKYVNDVIHKCGLDSKNDSLNIARISKRSVLPLEKDEVGQKLRFSLQVEDLCLKLWDSDADLAEIHIRGLEASLINKPRKTILRTKLKDFSIEDATSATLYPMILSIEDDHLFELKCSCYNKKSDIKRNNSRLQNDASVKFRLGRVQIVLLYKFFIEIAKFIDPFINHDVTDYIQKQTQEKTMHKLKELQTKSYHVKLDIDIHAPIVHIPQKTNSPNLLVLKFGDLTVKNSFEEVELIDNDLDVLPIIDHILVRLNSFQMSRAIVALNGTIQPQETIIEPVRLRLDVKRALPPHHKDVLQIDVSGTLETIKININPRDLSIILSIPHENFAEASLSLYSGTSVKNRFTVRQAREMESKFIEATDSNVRHVEIYKIVNIYFVFEGARILLTTDIDDRSLSPFHTAPEGLARFNIGKITLTMEKNSDTSREVKCTLQTVIIEDIRPDSDLVIRKILESCCKTNRNDNILINVTQPPIFDFTYKQTKDKDAAVDIMIEKLRLNISVPFFLVVAQFINNAWPAPFPQELLYPKSLPMTNIIPPPMIISEDGPSLSIYGNIKKPEIVLFANPADKHSTVLVLKAEIMFDLTYCLTQESMSATLGELQLFTCLNGKATQTAYPVLKPCNVEFTRQVSIIDDRVQMELTISEIDLRVSPTTIYIFKDVCEVLHQITDEPGEKSHKTSRLSKKLQEDLWSNRSVTPNMWLQIIDNDDDVCIPPNYPKTMSKEHFSSSAKKIQIVFEMENGKKHVPVILVKTSASMELHDWSKQMYMSGELQLEISYFSEKLNVWEPLVEPVMESENCYRPWEVMIKVFRQRSLPISCCYDEKECILDTDEIDGEVHYLMSRARASSDTSETDTDSETEMTIIKQRVPKVGKINNQKSVDSTGSMLSYPVDSDTENEESVFDKIAGAFGLGHMFSSDSSDGELSEADEEKDNSVADKPLYLSEDGLRVDAGNTQQILWPLEENVASIGIEDSVDSGVEDSYDNMATHIIVDTRDTLQVTLTPSAMDIIKDLVDIFMGSPKMSFYGSISESSPLQVMNKLGIRTKVIVNGQSYCGSPISPVEATFPNPLFDNLEEYADIVDSNNHEADFNNGNLEDNGDDLDGYNLRTVLANAGNLSLIAAHYLYKDEEPANKDICRDKVTIEVAGFNPINILLPQRSGTHFYTLHPQKNDVTYHVLLDVNVHHGKKIITIRSPLQVCNHLNQPLDLYCKLSDLESVGLDDLSTNPFIDDTKLATVEPEQIYDVPLFVAYLCKLFVQPSRLDYLRSFSGIWWQGLSTSKEKSQYLTCLPNSDAQKCLSMKLVCSEVKVKCPSIGNKHKTSSILNIYPPVILHNYLPYDIVYSMEGKQEVPLHAGENSPLYTVDLHRTHQISLEVQNYLGIPWAGSLEITPEMDEYKTVIMETQFDTEGGNKQLSLSVHSVHKASLEIYIYAPYWIVNKTGLPLQFRGSGSDGVFESQMTEEPLLFRFRKHKRRKAKIRVYNSKWSHSFSLDTIWSNGLVICRDKEREKKYQFLMTIALSSLQLTKIVTITPYFLVVNQTEHQLRYMEQNDMADLWIDIGPNQCVPFYPDSHSMKMYVKYNNSAVISQHFPINKAHSTVLRMDKGSALVVQVSGGITVPITIIFLPYNHGDGPVRVENLCEDIFIKIHQKSQGQVTLLNPNQSVLYTWDDPCSERTLLWNVYNRKKPGYPAFINKDGYGQQKVTVQYLKTPAIGGVISNKSNTGSISSSDDDTSDGEKDSLPLLRRTRKDKVIIFWVSYLDNMQRVLLFTQDERVAKAARKAIDAEKANLEIFMSLGGISISLINSMYQEVAYFSLTSAPSMWAVEINDKWKVLNVELASWLEDKWQTSDFHAELKDYIEVDFSKMQMTKPFFGQLKRTIHPAIWLQYRQSQHHTYIRTRMHRMQLDNQLPDAVFSTVFYSTPVPQYVVKGSGVRPFLELTVLRQQVPENNIDTFKYVKLLMQEFAIQLDKGFLLSVLDIFTNFQPKRLKESMTLQTELIQIHTPLKDVANKMIANRPQKVVFEYLHLSPIKLHISLSLTGHAHVIHKPPSSFKSDAIDFFLNTVGATLTEIKDVEIKMAYFERKGVLLTPQQLLMEIKSHYISQLVQQAYVLILGLDVLGNPYGLVKDFTEGLGDFFYEPFMGSIQGPEEFAEGLAKGAQSLLGHTIGGIAGTISLITGSLGHALTILSFDEEYKKKRRSRIQQRLETGRLPDTLVHAGRSFIMGIALGLSGVVVKPVQGAQQDGVEGFFKGIGKGLLGVITKPAGGVVDMVSMAFDGIRRAAELGENVVVRQRLPRYINPIKGIKFYSPYEAVGQRILQQLNRGHYADSDLYWSHAVLTKQERSDISLVTDRRVFLLEKCRFWGGWDIEWMIKLEDIVAVPAIVDAKLIFKIKQDDTGFSLFSGDERIIRGDDPLVLQWLQQKIESAIIQAKEEELYHYPA